MKGFVIEGIAIVLFAVAVAALGGLMQSDRINKTETQYQQQRIDNIKAGGMNDGRVDW